MRGWEEDFGPGRVWGSQSWLQSAFSQLLPSTKNLAQDPEKPPKGPEGTAGKISRPTTNAEFRRGTGYGIANPGCKTPFRRFFRLRACPSISRTLHVGFQGERRHRRPAARRRGGQGRTAGTSISTGATARPTPSTRSTPTISARRRGPCRDEVCRGREAGAARRGRRRSETGTVAARLY